MRDIQARGQPIRSISAVLPLRGVPPNVGAFVAATIDALGDAAPDFEVVIVDDGRSGGNARLTDEVARAYPSVRALHLERKSGYGAAVRAGIAGASKQFILLLDADRAYDPLQVEQFVQWGDSYDAILGYRRHADTVARRIVALLYAVIAQVLFGKLRSDVSCGFGLFRASVLKELPIRSNGRALHVEIAYRLRRQRATMHEVPVTHQANVRGRLRGSSLRATLNTGVELLALKRRIIAERRGRAHAGAEQPAVDHERDATAGMS